MAFKFIAFFALVAVARAGNLVAPLAYHAAPALATYAAPFTYSGSSIGSSQQNVVRSFAGTVSSYSKAVDSPYSSVRKVDTRINNNVYTPAYATKTLAYAAPAPIATYAHPAPIATYAAAHPAPIATYAAHPASLAVAHPAPIAYAKTYAPAVYAHPAAPLAVASHASPITSAYSTKAISYSPASAVAHLNFDGFGVHYGY